MLVQTYSRAYLSRLLRFYSLLIINIPSFHCVRYYRLRLSSFYRQKKNNDNVLQTQPDVMTGGHVSCKPGSNNREETLHIRYTAHWYQPIKPELTSQQNNVIMHVTIIVKCFVDPRPIQCCRYSLYSVHR